MPNFNRVILMGNLTRDPVLRYAPSGTPVADFGMAVNESYKNKTTGEQIDKTCFVDVSIWFKQAESCEKYLSKGSPVLIEGRLELDQWTNQQGEKRSKLRVRADRVQFLGGPRNAEFRDTSAQNENPAREKSSDVQDGNPDAGGNHAVEETPMNDMRNDDALPF